MFRVPALHRSFTCRDGKASTTATATSRRSGPAAGLGGRPSALHEKPYLKNGSWEDYRRQGQLRILPHLGRRKLTSLTAPELRACAVELSESDQWAPKTLNNALKALVPQPRRRRRAAPR
jgi:hypothetical protein